MKSEFSISESISLPALHRQARRILPFFILLTFIPATVITAVSVAVIKTGLPAEKFARDPATLLNAHPFTGFLSNIGILMWCFSVTIYLFSAHIVRQRPTSKETSNFFLFIGLVTAMLMLDDFFLLHEVIFPRHLHLSEDITYGLYATALGGVICRYAAVILRSDFLLLILAIGFLGSSVGVDFIQSKLEAHFGNWRILVEDGLKLLGITMWFGYAFRICSTETAICSR